MTDEKSGAPPCGLFYAIKSVDDLSDTLVSFRQMAMVVNRTSGFEKNMNIVMLDAEGIEEKYLSPLVKTIQENGFIALLDMTDTQKHLPLASGHEMDGVIVHTAEHAPVARDSLGQDAIICLHSYNKPEIIEAALTEPLQDLLDCIAIGLSGYGNPDTRQIKKWHDASDKPCIALGDLTNDTCGLYAQAGATFVDVTTYLNTYEKGTMQATVNCLYALELVEK